MKTPLIILFYLCISLKINGQIKSDFLYRTMLSAAEEINNCNKKGTYDSSHINIAYIKLHDFYSIDSFCISIDEDFLLFASYSGDAKYYFILDDVLFLFPPTNRETEFAALIGFEPMTLQVKLILEEHWVNDCAGDRDFFLSKCSNLFLDVPFRY